MNGIATAQCMYRSEGRNRSGLVAAIALVVDYFVDRLEWNPIIRANPAVRLREPQHLAIQRVDLGDAAGGHQRIEPLAEALGGLEGGVARLHRRAVEAIRSSSVAMMRFVRYLD